MDFQPIVNEYHDESRSSSSCSLLATPQIRRDSGLLENVGKGNESAIGWKSFSEQLRRDLTLTVSPLKLTQSSLTRNGQAS